MFTTIQGPEYSENANLLDQMFRLRKKVFADQLKWDVPVSEGRERDYYDGLSPAYLVWCSDDRQTLYGSIRMMPTTGPTLLYDVFEETIPEAASLMAPGIWEVTRCCVDTEKLALDYPGLNPTRAFGLLCLATAECAVAHGIHTLVSNYEPHMARIYRKAGATFDEIGRADGYGRHPVCCAAFEMSDASVLRMRSALGIDLPLYRRMKGGDEHIAERAA